MSLLVLVLFILTQLINATEEYTDAANYQHVRLFKVAHNISTVPLDDLSAVATPWSLPQRSKLNIDLFVNNFS